MSVTLLENSSFSLTESDIPLSEMLPWNMGHHFSFFWICYITVLSFGVLLNGVTFLFMVLNKNIHGLTSVSVVKYLVAEDFLSSLVCLIQCCLNYHSGGLLGDHVGCAFEGWQVSFFITITGYSLALISYIVRVNVTSKAGRKKSRDLFIFKCHICFWVLGALFAVFSAVWPGNSRLNSSGTYCLAAFEKPFGAVFFFGVAVFPTVLFLISQYLWIYIHVYQARSKVDQDKNGDKSRGYDLRNKNLKLAQQLGSLVLVYFICYTPFLASAMYEWITQKYAPPFVDFTGVLTHVASVANPIMYLWTSNQAKAELIRLWNDNVHKDLMFETPITSPDPTDPECARTE